MYRIQDFHSTEAPALESGMPQFFGGMELVGDDDCGEMDPFAALLVANARAHAVPSGSFNGGSFNYDDPRYLVVVASDERIVIEDVAAQNEDGWTPLHACCHTFTTVSAGIAIIGPRGPFSPLFFRWRQTQWRNSV